MKGLYRFEDLECWIEARNLSRKIYRISRKMTFEKDYRLSGQITGATLSIMNNIAEGFGCRSNSEFMRFLIYSRRSCCETQNCLYVALDQQYICNSEFIEIYEHIARVRQIIDGLIRYLKKTKIPKK